MKIQVGFIDHALHRSWATTNDNAPIIKDIVEITHIYPLAMKTYCGLS